MTVETCPFCNHFFFAEDGICLICGNDQPSTLENEVGYISVRDVFKDSRPMTSEERARMNEYFWSHFKEIG